MLDSIRKKKNIYIFRTRSTLHLILQQMDNIVRTKRAGAPQPMLQAIRAAPRDRKAPSLI